MMLGSALPRPCASVGILILASASVTLGTIILAPWLRRALLKPKTKKEEDKEGDDAAHEFGVLLFYEYAAILDVTGTIKSFENICRRLDLRGRLRISEEGFNGNLTGSMDACQAFIEAVQKDFMELRGTDFKLARCSAKHLFHNLKVWASEEVCGLFAAQDGSERAVAARSLVGAERGRHLSPQEWHDMMQNAGDDVVLFDVRNRYETRIGRFARNCTHLDQQGLPVKSDAELSLIDPNTRFFHEVPHYLSREENINQFRGKKVMMYCTGGVRCERTSALLKQHLGDETDVYQLAGGIQRYLETHPDGGYFEGSMHVFDRREHVSAVDCVGPCSDVSADPQPSKVIGSCVVCGTPWEKYQGKWRCGECSLLILICSHCQGCYSNRSKRNLLRCELCETKVSAGDLQRAPMLADVAKMGTQKEANVASIPSGLNDFGERAKALKNSNNACAVLPELVELLNWLNSRRLRVKFAEDLTALRAVRDFYLEARRQEQVDVVLHCAEVAEKLLRDQVSRSIVWQELRPEEMAGWLLDLGQLAKVNSDHVALQILWRLAEVSDARGALVNCCASLYSVLVDTRQRNGNDVSILREICMVIRYFADITELRPLLWAEIEARRSLFDIAIEAVELSFAIDFVGTTGARENLALAAVAALAILLKFDTTVPSEIRQRIRVAAKHVLEMHAKIPNVKKWASLLLEGEARKDPETNASTTPPICLQTVQTAPQKLSDVANVELLQMETASTVREIWLERFAASSNVIAGVMTKEEFNTIWIASLACPTFLAPVPRSMGLTNLVLQCHNGVVYFQALDSFKGGAAGAGSGRADLVLTLLPELSESHGVVLIYGLLCSDFISKAEAIGLVRFFRAAYSQPQWLHWVRQFNTSPNDFDVDAFFAEFTQTR